MPQIPSSHAGRRACAITACAAMLTGGVGLFPERAMADVASDRAAVTASLEDSAKAWSQNDLRGFMNAYENAPSTTYLKESGVVRGFDAIQAMYAARFGGTAGKTSGSLGQLSMVLIEFRPLGPDYASCIGSFSLVSALKAAKSAHGMFTLIFHRTPNGWKIVSDHTSS